ncbi:MAG: MotA/TolQ/ExbB proton channel family protein [Desulfobacterium sp.]
MDFIHDLYRYLSQGGLVMIPLILCSLTMWTLILDRMFYFYAIERRDIELHRVTAVLKEERVPMNRNGLKTHLLHHFLKHRTGDPFVDKRILDECAMSMAPKLTNFLSVIAILAAVSPLFGLLGTVTGMITTFDVITLFGTGNPRAMAGGISEALVTTQSGLMVSIPGLFMSVLLFRRSARAQAHLKEAIMILKRSLQ